jgi:hypothetical protein
LLLLLVGGCFSNLPGCISTPPTVFLHT